MGDDPALWSAEDAARLLGPPVISVTQVRNLIRVASLAPAGKRKSTAYGSPGRYARVYQAADLIRLYDAIERVMHV